MKPFLQTSRLLLCLLLSAVVSASAQTNISPAIFPDEDTLTPETLRLVWSSSPGLRYEVKQSTNLQVWTTASGFPTNANGPAQQFPFSPSGKSRFFQVRQLDEQPPVVVSQYPTAGGFAVPRFSNLTLQLSDATGINTNSIRLTVGTLGTFALTNAQLTFSNNFLTFINGGSIPLGGWGSNVTATLIMADTLGYSVTNIWSFTLEVQPVVATNLFVFGSPQAQRTGQQVGNIPTRELAQHFGPIPMGAGDPWTLELVASNRLELSYTNTAPGFATNTYVCNLTPVRPEDIFNRKIIGISDNLGIKRLTLFTVEVPLTEISTNASVTITGDSRLLTTGTNGAFVQMLSISGTIPFPRIGYSLDGASFTLKNTSGFNVVSLALEEEHWWLTPKLQVSMEIYSGSLQRFEAIAKGNIESASIWNANFLLAGIAYTNTLFELSEAQKLKLKKWMLLGYVGPVPVFASLGFDLQLKGRAEVNTTLSFRAGKRETSDAAFGLTYTKPNVQWVNTFNFPPPEVIPFTGSINSAGSLKVSLEPAVEFLVYGLAGVSAGITPSGGVVFEVGTEQCLSGRFEADVSLGLGLAGPAFELLNPKPELSLPLWQDKLPLFGCTNLAFTQQPQSQTVPLGSSAYFFCTVSSDATPGYQWYFNNVPMPGQTARTLPIPSVKYGHEGNYQVRVTAGGQTTNSAVATLTVVSSNTPPNMALIPAGSFKMGDALNDNAFSGDAETPLHSVYVSAFYMDRYEVSKAMWDEVYNWAITNGYSFEFGAAGKANNHPAHTMTWYDAVKWCNARSEKEGLTPAYYTSAGQTVVYRGGQINVENNWVKWNIGYRLPTEAEWEKAARGGVGGRRFPWGNTINQSQANYLANPITADPLYGYAYDVNPTQGYHPTFATGGPPYTSPVGYFAPNGYGLYDIIGNLGEWCWDYAGNYGSAPQTDPRGPVSGLYRMYRGGSWSNVTINSRTASRTDFQPSERSSFRGFRSVLSTGR